MFFVYVLKSLKEGNLYTGFSSNLVSRIKRHNDGLVISTRIRRPLKLIYFEACLNKHDALKREIYLKTSWGKRFVKNRIKMYLKS